MYGPSDNTAGLPQALQMHQRIGAALDRLNGCHLEPVTEAGNSQREELVIVRLYLKLDPNIDLDALVQALADIGLDCCRKPTFETRGVFVYPAAQDMDFFLFVEFEK